MMSITEQMHGHTSESLSAGLQRTPSHPPRAPSWAAVGTSPPIFVQPSSLSPYSTEGRGVSRDTSLSDKSPIVRETLEEKKAEIHRTG